MVKFNIADDQHRSHGESMDLETLNLRTHHSVGADFELLPYPTPPPEGQSASAFSLLSMLTFG